MRLDLTDAAGAPSCGRRCSPTSRASSATRPRRDVAFVPRRLEVAFGSDRAAPELQRGLALGDGLTLSGKIDRIDIDPFSARGIVQDYKSGKGAHSARDIDRELRLQIPLYVLVLRDLVGVEPLGGVYRALAGQARARAGCCARRAREDLPGLREGRLPRRGRVLGAGRDRARARGDVRAADPRRRRAPRSEGRRLPRVVRPLDDLPGAARMTVVDETRPG